MRRLERWRLKIYPISSHKNKKSTPNPQNNPPPLPPNNQKNKNTTKRYHNPATYNSEHSDYQT